jgi:hypothetical protein
MCVCVCVPYMFAIPKWHYAVVPCDVQNAIISLNGINRFVAIIDTGYVLCEVWTEVFRSASHQSLPLTRIIIMWY